MKIGFTGTQRGMSQLQAEGFLAMLAEGSSIATTMEFHHGMCIGSDEQAHNLVRSFLPKIRIIGHPPVITAKMMKYDPAEFAFIHEPKPYLDRNHDIVDATDILSATPGEVDEQLRSGTWATIRYARKIGRVPVIIKPDGCRL